MKLCLSLVLIFGAAFGQKPVTVPSPFQPPAPPPDSQKPAIAPDTIVLVEEGKPYTAKDLDQWLSQYPPQIKDAVAKNPDQELTRLFAMRALAAEGMNRKLDQLAPYKDAIESRVRQYLASVLVQDEGTHFHATEEALKAYYEAHKDQYQSVKISAIYVNYTPNPKAGADGKMPRSEAEAKTKADDLVKQLRAGGAFAKLAADQSDDKESAKKGGDYATIKRSDNYPAQIKEAIFKLKDGEISEPVKQVPGFYIFKVTDRITQPYAEVQPTLFDRVRQAHVDEFMKNMQKDLAPKVLKSEYFTGVKAPTLSNATPILPIGAADGAVVNIGGKDYTAKEMDEYLRLLPPQAKQAMAKEPESSLTSLFMILRLSDEARKRKLDQESPHKEALAMFTMDGVTNAYVVEKRNSIELTPAETEAFYKSHQEQLEQAKVSAIVIYFGDAKTHKEDEAKAIADRLVKQVREGADFAMIAKANSEDKDSAEKGGDYATVHRTDKIAEPTKKAIFALKEGEISEPLRQTNGFFIFKLNSKSVAPLTEVAASISQAAKQEKFNQWMNGLQTQYKPKIEKPEYFKK